MNIKDFKWILHHHYMTVDPGVNTGWCYVRRNSAPITGVFRGECHMNHSGQLNCLGIKFRQVIDAYRPKVVIIEDSEFRPGSRKGQVSAASGALLLLSKIVGGYTMLADIPVLMPAYVWKGNLPEEVVARRVYKATGKQYREHEQEAVGIHLALAGRF
jgi:hypothetical protein